MYQHQVNRMTMRQKLAYKIKSFFANDVNLAQHHNQIVRIDLKISNDIEPLKWLIQQKSSVKTYWSDREHKFEIAGIGEADVFFGKDSIDYSSLFTKLQKRLSPVYKHLRYYGGISFRQKAVIDPSWGKFGNYRFIVPKFEVYAENNETYLACNFILKDYSDYQLQLNRILYELDQLIFRQPAEIKYLPSLLTRKDLPNKKGWYENIETVLASFAQGKTEKIVLARKSIFEFVESIEPLHLLLLLQNTNPELFHFCFQPSVGNAFIGGSPERLYSRQERLLQTEAMAGTRRRGKSTQEDQELSQELLTSEKDIREQQFVVYSLRSILHQLCHSIGKIRKPSLLKLNKVQHLYTPCNGILLDEVSDADILPKLHPTPAVGGYPREQALIAIEEIEPFDRGWYAGPVGWIGHNSAEFAVAIRSGLVEDNQLSLFSGAGIVQGSQPEQEWQEIEHKIGSFVQILGYSYSSENILLSKIA